MSAINHLIARYKEGSLDRQKLFELVGKLSGKQVAFALAFLQEIIGKRYKCPFSFV